jgi:ribosomal protein S28E/S33
MRDMQHVEVLIHTKYWEGSTKVKKKLTETGADGREILRWILGEIKVYEI